MLNIKQTRPTKQQVLNNIEQFENFCLGKESYTPSTYREINEELSVSTVLVLGKHKFQKDALGKRLIWKGLDEKEYDLGYTHNAKIMRNYPGFHRKSIQAMGKDIKEIKVINQDQGTKNISVVTLQDGTEGIGPDNRIALRNAVLKRHLKTQFNHFSLSNLWKQVWGHA